MAATREGYMWCEEGSKKGLTTSAVVNGCTSIRDAYDVVVIGAGFAGLIAARDISQQTNLSVLLVEARDRIGGRTWTAMERGQEFEMGAGWIHWTQPHVWTELQRYEMDKDLVSSDGSVAPKKVFFTPAEGPPEEMQDDGQHADFDALAQAFFNIDDHTSRSLMPLPHDPFREPAPWKQYDHLSVKDRIEQMRTTSKFSNQDVDIFEGITNGSGLTGAEKRGFPEFLFFWALGGHSMAGITEANGVWKIGKGGMTEFARRMLADFRGDVIFDAQVASIRQNSGECERVRLGLKDRRSVDAGRVISTIPLNCLSTIAFVPPLAPTRQQAIDQGHINLGSKIHLELSGATPPWTAFCSPSSNAKLTSALSDHSTTTNSYAVAFGYSDAHLDLNNPASILPELQYLFPRDQRPEITAYVTHDWARDPFSKGAWAAFAPGLMSRFQQELQRDHGKVMFASGDRADGWRGYVDGAMAEGAKAARRIIQEAWRSKGEEKW